MRNRNGVSTLRAPDRTFGLVQENIVIDMKVAQIVGAIFGGVSQTSGRPAIARD
jgi:hypothetical protein